ncbi:two-component sensor histidine kinase BarA [Pseudoalteromonas sp. Cnat2-41]|uniref:two-component sensor histidine kinase BarA n=1 Tax=unclassified Pseudoalteromonas TaxID=194690 RepID=UPI001EF7A168|nr:MULTISPECIES: two-component sensor histidine kinase BarA [unclassified Pseudoalteromonas]MCF2863405.1 two-component sensor histidine kinase BarA [Pseudoalteromonas sp. CNAT2-18]MCG7558358.1 two-component sensor histidine kinase BarA [Pseudoalteromonas sp. CNAT2-18.1]MCG7567717.1 two-component sensor histidine kinase BarA [Pseudoalteromonas sp. CnMc7-15]
MNRLGLRDSVLILTLVPTVVIGLLLGGYFTINRYLELDEFLIEQGNTIIEPLSIALENPLANNDQGALERIARHIHNKHSPLIKSVAIFDSNDELVLASNLHREFARLTQVPTLDNKTSSKTTREGDFLVIYHGILDPNAPSHQPFKTNGIVMVQFNRQVAVVEQQKAVLISAAVILLAIGFAVVISIRLSRMITQPLSRLVQATQEVAHGKEADNIQKPMQGELEQLRQGLLHINQHMAEEKDEMQRHIDQATADYQETLEQYEMQNIQLNIAKRDALAANQVKSDFLAKMSHELRTPLNGVIGFARQLYKTPLNKNQKDYLDTIELSANSLLTIISDILDFSKLEAGAMELESIQFQIRDAVNEVLTLLAPGAHEKNLELSIHVNPNVPDHLVGDPTRFRQILTNLVSNAIKFTEHGEVNIDISSRLLNDERVSLLISVKDTGVGIAMDKQDTLFTPFGQADSSITRKFGGTGLGLIITKHLVEAMGGRITLNSAPGKGTCFTFNAVFKVPEHHFELDLPCASLVNKRVLYFEQNEHSYMATSSILAAWGVHLTGCRTIEELEQAASNAFNYDICVLGDPGGAESMARMKQLIAIARQCSDYLYLLLNTVSHNMREALVGSGADGCLSKPINHRKFCEMLAAPFRLDHPTIHTHDHHTTRLPLKALVVDDNDANLKLICALLEEQVESLDTAHNGAQAVEVCKSHRYDLIFMDIQMPIMDGITACKLILESSLNEDTPIIAVTAHALDGEKEQLKHVGFASYLTKPLDEDMLSDALLHYAPNDKLARERVSAKPPLSEPPFISDSLNWELALQRAGGKEDLAQEMLNMLLLSIPETLNLIEEAMAKDDHERLLSIIHKFHGACCYTGVPKLKKLAELIETAMKEKASINDIEPELLELQDELSNLMADAGLEKSSSS